MDPFRNRLLAIDDERALGILIKRVAESVGYEIEFTDDSAVFTRTARTWEPTVIMLDLQMPDMDGIQLLRGLAGDRCTADILITSGSDAKVLDAAMQLGRERGLRMSGALMKPLRVDMLRETLARFKRQSKVSMADDLAEAIASDQLFLEYQPKLDCHLDRFTGVEALVRWRHPVRGIVRPDQFIGLAEESQLIHRLTDWVVLAAARQAAEWRNQNLDLEVAVNISAKDVEDLDLPERLQQHCAHAGLPPAAMTLELTETGAMNQAILMMDVLTRLRLKGFKLSIDDFGTGYSSLVQLQQMPFSEVKIDQSFVKRMIENEGCRVIAGIIIELARRLGLECAAEGVEDQITLTTLIEMGCHKAQGYHLSRPLSPFDTSNLIRRHSLAQDNR